jgi:hypothetical protein
VNDQGQTWTLSELERELLRFEGELRAAGLAETSVKTYVKGPETFLRWLSGDYVPQGPQS